MEDRSSYEELRKKHIETLELSERNVEGHYFTNDELEKQARKLARKWHPDRAKNEEEASIFTEQFKQIQSSKDWMISFGDDEEKWRYEVGGANMYEDADLDDDLMDHLFGHFMDDLFFEHLFRRHFSGRQYQSHHHHHPHCPHSRWSYYGRRESSPSSDEIEKRLENEKKEKENKIENLRNRDCDFDALFLKIKDLKLKKEKLNGPKNKKKRKKMNKELRKLEEEFEDYLSTMG